MTSLIKNMRLFAQNSITDIPSMVGLMRFLSCNSHQLTLGDFFVFPVDF
jgi:hypothetical protein